MVAPSFLTELATHPREDREQLRTLLLDTLGMESQLMAQAGRPRGIRSFAQLVRYHDQLAARKELGLEAEALRRPLPPPPFPGTPVIRAIDTPQKLIAEAQEQKNCALSYLPRICAGKVCLYSVMAPERATMALEKGPRGRWRISQIAARRNGPVSDATREAVEIWLAGQRRLL
jgi:hypothetical protein